MAFYKGAVIEYSILGDHHCYLSKEKYFSKWFPVGNINVDMSKII